MDILDEAGDTIRNIAAALAAAREEWGNDATGHWHHFSTGGGYGGPIDGCPGGHAPRPMGADAERRDWTRWCLYPAPPLEFACSREIGHRGDHSCDSRSGVRIIWSQSPVPAARKEEK